MQSYHNFCRELRLNFLSFKYFIKAFPKTGFFINNKLWIDLVNCFNDLVSAHFIELHYQAKGKAQVIMQELLEDKNFMIQRNFYKFIPSKV